MKTNRTFLIISAVILMGFIFVSWLLAPTITPAFLNAVLMFVLPLSIGALIFSRTKADWSLFGLGALTFVLSQVLHLPFNSYILEPVITSLGLEMLPKTLDLLFIGLLYGLSAGIFEEFSRYFIYRKYLSEHRSWETGVMFGAGHGGIEAILLGVLVLYTFLQMLTLQGASPDVLAGSLPVEQVDLVILQIDQFWAFPWWMHILGAVERLFAITMHIGMALLVQRAVLRKEARWLALALLFHTLIDTVAVYGSVSYGALATEVILFILALASLFIIIRFRKEYLLSMPDPVEETGALPLKPIKTINVEYDLNSKLEESKYD